jgi:hypothetical protein
MAIATSAPEFTQEWWVRVPQTTVHYEDLNIFRNAA